MNRGEAKKVKQSRKKWKILEENGINDKLINYEGENVVIGRT